MPKVWMSEEHLLGQPLPRFQVEDPIGPNIREPEHLTIEVVDLQPGQIPVLATFALGWVDDHSRDGRPYEGALLAEVQPGKVDPLLNRPDPTCC